MTENNPQKPAKWIFGTMLLHNKYKVFYGDDFPKKKLEMLGSVCTKPRPP